MVVITKAMAPMGWHDGQRSADQGEDIKAHPDGQHQQSQNPARVAEHPHQAGHAHGQAARVGLHRTGLALRSKREEEGTEQGAEDR